MPEGAGDECQADEDDHREQHGRREGAALAPVPGVVEVLMVLLVLVLLLAAASMMERIKAILFVKGGDVVARGGIKVVEGFDVGVGKDVESVIRGSREWTH